jgi:prolyl oligopeptidase
MMSAFSQSGVVETIHGVEVSDPYRWLEDRQRSETLDWLNRQQYLCNRYFSRSKNYTRLKRIVYDTLSVDVIDQVARVGRSLFFRKQTRGQEQAAIWVRREDEDEDRLLLDPAEVGSSIAAEILRISFNGLFLAYSVRSSGSDAMETRIMDVERGVTLPDRLPLSHLRGFEFDTCAKGFYYCVEPIGGTQVLSIKHHQFGDTSYDDTLVFSIPRSEYRRLVLASSNGTLAALVTQSIGANKVQDLFVTNELGTTPWKPVYTGMVKRMWPLFAQGRIFLFDQDGALNGRIVEIIGEDFSTRVVVPEAPSTLQRCSVMQGCLLLTYLADRRTRIERWSIDGNYEGTIALPAGESVEVLPSLSDSSQSLFLRRESYTDAPCIWETSLAKPLALEQLRWTAFHEKSSANVLEHWYTSRDGTRIPMVLLEPARKRFLGARPVILTGYGGFGAAELPRFSRLARILIDLGATIARPSIRGGSEFGEEWHRAATRSKRQVAIDDFLAAADWLCSENISDESNLCIMGSSNGGLLVAAAVTQRPDLFRAVLCIGPLTDMVRYERFDQAFKWRDEYGSVEDVKEFLALLSYSPYHNIEDPVNYPAMLFVTGDADDRCNAAHARKMAAALQGRTAQHQPILVDHAQGWGHVPTLSLSERVEALSRKVAFLCDQLGITVPGGETGDVLIS